MRLGLKSMLVATTAIVSVAILVPDSTLHAKPAAVSSRGAHA